MEEKHATESIASVTIKPDYTPSEYCSEAPPNRIWRKNRRLSDGATCYGTDLNRNFGYFWMHAGASNNSCLNTYAGPEAFSEPESRALRNMVQNHLENARLYLTFHSYGEYLLYPWGYAVVYPDNAEELQSLGNLAAEAIASASTIGSSYLVANSAAALYAAAGANSPYAFMIPARQILTVDRETWEGVKVFHSYIEEKFWTNVNPRGPLKSLKVLSGRPIL
ncbi:hypothetical protein HUJ05_006318 [Dendroctonus ponderosae]|nr:hypothetical protein HUJ05_006318 [Dendroctonus ponderosae]